MKVLVISDIWEQSPVYEQTKELSERTSNIEVIVPVRVIPPLKRYKDVQDRNLSKLSDGEEMIREIKIKYLKYYSVPELHKYVGAFSLLASLLVYLAPRRWRDFDIIHAHFAYTVGPAGLLLGKLLKKKVIINVHGSDIIYYTRKHLKYFFTRIMAIYVLKSCDRVFCHSDAMRIRVQKLGIDLDKISLICFGVRADTFKPMDKDRIREKLGLPSHRKIVLFVGNLVQRKGVNYLIDSTLTILSEIEDLLVVLVGDGPLMVELKNRAKSLGVEKTVKFVGAKPHWEIPRWMNACDLFVFPSLDEAFGLVSLEAFACGKPVVASRVDGIPEIVKSSDYGILVKSKNSEELAGGIIRGLKKRWDTGKMIEYAQSYSWEDSAVQLLGEYEKLWKKKREQN